MSAPEIVVLLHGLGRTSLSMERPRRLLARAGFEAIAPGYASLRRPIPELASELAARLGRRLAGDERPVHFLTHSMGGIVLRAMLDAGPPPFSLGRAVMLAPPNRGSDLAERLGSHRWLRRAMGPAFEQLRAGASNLPERLGPAGCEVGIVAGNRATSPWSFLVAEDSDGTVRVDETALPGMDDFLVVPRGHTFIMNDAVVIEQAIRFFRTGRFAHEPDDAAADQRAG